MRVPIAVPLALVALSVSAATSLQVTDPSRYDIAFIAKGTDGSRLHVARGDGTEATLVRADAASVLTRFSWSPDGRRLAYLTSSAEDEDLLKKFAAPMHIPLYAINADGSGRQRLLDVPVEPFFRWSPDGRRMVFSSGFEDPSRDDPRVRQGLQAIAVAVYALDVQSRTVTRLTALGENRFASWSPDGLRIVFSGSIQAPNRDIYVVDADGTNLRRLTTDPTVDGHPQWSPRGDEIAYVAAPRPSHLGTEGGVFVVKPDGSGIRRISTAFGSDVAWSPDGAHLLVHSSPAQLVDVATGSTTEPVPAGCLDPTFAPDGRAILYRVREAGSSPTWSMYAADLDGRNARTLASSMTTFAVGPLRPRSTPGR